MPIEIAGVQAAEQPKRDVRQAMLRGAICRCPACGDRPLFSSYLKVVHACDQCGAEMHHQKADDGPAYFTMFIVGHIVIGGLLSMEQAYAPPTWVQLAIWLPVTLILSLALLPMVKGAMIGLQWALRMHGFGTGPDPASPLQDPRSTATPTR